jgi:hypothetical protein
VRQSFFYLQEESCIAKCKILSKYFKVNQINKHVVILYNLYNENKRQAEKNGLQKIIIKKLSTWKNGLKWGKVTYTRSCTHYPHNFYVN